MIKKLRKQCKSYFSVYILCNLSEMLNKYITFILLSIDAMFNVTNLPHVVISTPQWICTSIPPSYITYSDAIHTNETRGVNWYARKSGVCHLEPHLISRILDRHAPVFIKSLLLKRYAEIIIELLKIGTSFAID